MAGRMDSTGDRSAGMTRKNTGTFNTGTINTGTFNTRTLWPDRVRCGLPARAAAVLAVLVSTASSFGTGVAAPSHSSAWPTRPPAGHVQLGQAAGGPASVPAAGLAHPGLPVALDAVVTGDLQATTVRFTLSRALPVSAFVLEKPDRAVIDLPEANFQFGSQFTMRGGGLATTLRYGLFGAGRSRMVIELAHPALVQADVSPPRSDGTVTVTIRLQRTERERFQAAMRVEPRPVPAPVPSPEGLSRPEMRPDSRPVVVIDPGHGGIDPGALGKGGVPEKQVVFEIARLVRDRLAESARVRVMMTRDRDIFVSLGDRVALARKENAQLFVSLHADMLAGHQGVRGASIYTGSEKATDAEAARLAESENRADSVAGAEQADEVRTDVADILSDLTRRETRVFSHRFARTLGARMGETLTMHKKMLREAGFRVLRAPDVPSVLIELGYLSNATDAELLLSADGQSRAAAAIAAAIEAYFERRAAP